MTPGAADVRSWYYADNSGVSVKTLAAGVEQPISKRAALSVRGMVEQIILERKPLDVGDPGAMQGTGHPPHSPDAVTSASATAGGGSAAREWRFEGVGAAAMSGEVACQPAIGRVLVKASTEPDYGSIYGNVGGQLELAERNVTVAGFAGFGRDRVDPVEAPPGEADEWPAHHQRVNGGASFSQLLSPTLVLSTGMGMTHQWGQLASPYRRALVVTTLFPEIHPDHRTRGTAFASLAWYLGHDVALHLRQGLYADSWEVVALIPELAAVADLGERLVGSLRYRFYKQWPARFYQGRYHALESTMTGDPRLGPIQEHVAAAEARWTLLADPIEPTSISVVAGYELSLLDYQAYATNVIVAHILSLGVSGRY